MTDATNPSAKTGGAVLLPCPFCGDGGEVRQTHDEFSRPRSVVVCRGCGARSDASIGDLRASNEWNTRTHPQPSLSVGLDGEVRERLVADARMLTENYSAGDDRHRMGTDLRSLLALSAPAEGYVLVPREPTEAMVAANYEAHARSKSVFAPVTEVWSAMIAACLPAAPTGGRS